MRTLMVASGVDEWRIPMLAQLQAAGGLTFQASVGTIRVLNILPAFLCLHLPSDTRTRLVNIP